MNGALRWGRARTELTRSLERHLLIPGASSGPNVAACEQLPLTQSSLSLRLTDTYPQAPKMLPHPREGQSPLRGGARGADTETSPSPTS